MRGEFVGELVGRLRLTDNNRAFELVEPFRYTSSYGLTITCPAGMTTDLASIPFFVRIFCSKLDRTTWAAVTHDRCCDTKEVSRREADFLFFEAMQISGVGLAKRWAYWAGVRAWGIICQQLKRA